MMANKVLIHNLSEPLNGTKTTTVNIDTDSGNLTLDTLTGGEQLLASGLGKVIVDSRFSKIDDTTYQSADYNTAANTVEISVHSGAGNVSVDTK